MSATPGTAKAVFEVFVAVVMFSGAVRLARPAAGAHVADAAGAARAFRNIRLASAIILPAARCAGFVIDASAALGWR